MSQPTDLRARRRMQTTRDIHEAALRLAHQVGYDNVTIEQISAEAGISQRTFFNYFPTKESAVVSTPFQLSDDLATQFIALGPAPRSVILTDVIRMLADHLEGNAPSLHEFHDILTLARQHDSVLAAMLSNYETSQASVAAVVAQRLGTPEDNEIPEMIARIALTTVRAGVDQWSLQAIQGRTSVATYVERSADVLRSLLASDSDLPEAQTPDPAVRSRISRRET